LKEQGIIVVHVVSNVKFALKAEAAGVDAVVAEGFEAGGHNGREETTTMVLIPMVRKAIKIPLIAAGGVVCGASMLAALALGADGVQVGSRFVASIESSAHLNFKNAVIESEEGSTQLTLKELTPVRLLKNKFFDLVNDAEKKGTEKEKLQLILGKGRAKKGMFEGDLNDGELEIGQVAGAINEIKSAADIINDFIIEYKYNMYRIQSFLF
jgi:enoyl-[acyl-carrier protein] reductase II